MEFWSVPPLWRGDRAVILGGGPSLTREDVDACRGQARAIAVNDGYLLAPWADVLYGCDAPWWEWHKSRVASFAGIKVGLHDKARQPDIPGIRWLRRGPNDGLAEQSDTVALGSNGGYQAINLAVHLGVSRIILLGFDCQAQSGRRHWFGDHPPELGNPGSARFAIWQEHFAGLAPLVARRGVEIINCSRQTALTCFTRADLQTCLSTSAAMPPLPATSR